MTSLKEATEIKHKEAERRPFNMRMFQGQLSQSEYLLYLAQQRAIFDAIEAKELPHAALARQEAIDADIQELLDQGNPNPPTLAATTRYVDYLQTLDQQGLQPHVYLNYLAIMFGGQMMKSKVPSTGKMYDFDQMPAPMQSIRAIQQDAWAPEVNAAYDYIIAIFDELEEAILAQQA